MAGLTGACSSERSDSSHSKHILLLVFGIGSTITAKDLRLFGPGFDETASAAAQLEVAAKVPVHVNGNY